MAADKQARTEPVSDTTHTEEAVSLEQLLCPFRRALQDLNAENKTVEALSRAAKKAGRTPNSKSTMHTVQQCVRLPASGAVAAYVAAVTDNDAALVEKFIEWRTSIATKLRRESAHEAEPPQGGHWTRRRLGALVMGTALITAVITALITSAVVTPAR